MSIRIKLDSTAEDFLSKAKKEISYVGGNLNGDSSNGDFSVPTRFGNIKGNYEFEESYIAIDIVDKPYSISIDRIRSEVNKYI